MAKRRTLSRKTAAKATPNRAESVRRDRNVSRFDIVYQQVRAVLASARDRAWQAVNTAMVDAYWEVGRIIVEEEQAGKGRADYGKRVLEELSVRLTADFGKGFDPSNLRNMRMFFLVYPIRDALRHELSWTHYRHLLRSINPTLGRSTRRRRSMRTGRPASWRGRSTRCCSSASP
jgi:hypothetical protein